MKKTVAFALILLLMLPMAVLAEGTDWKTYTHPVMGYQISHPADWTVITPERGEELIAFAQSAELEGIDPSLLADDPEYDGENLVTLTSPRGDLGVNISYEDLGVSLSPQLITEVICPMMAGEMQSVFTNAEIITEAALVKMGQIEYAVTIMRYQIMGMDATLILTYCMEGNILYTISYTILTAFSTDETGSVMDQISVSFVP